MPLDLEGVGVLNTPQIELTQRSQSYRFRNVSSRPALSINRGFSAPVRISGGTTLKDRLFLMGHDSDPFNRWEAAQTAGTSLVVGTMKAVAGTGKMPSLSGFIEALRRVLKSPDLDDAFKAALLVLLGAGNCLRIGQDIDPSVVHEARERVRRTVASALSAELNDVWKSDVSEGPYRPAPAETGRRSLRYAVLSLMTAGDPHRAPCSRRRSSQSRRA